MLKSLTEAFRKRDKSMNGVINVHYEDVSFYAYAHRKVVPEESCFLGCPPSCFLVIYRDISRNTWAINFNICDSIYLCRKMIWL